MRRFTLILFIILLAWTDVLTVNVPAPEYTISGEELNVAGATYKHLFGAPNLPCKTVTLALPPGAIVEKINYHGSRIEIGKLTIHPKLPPFHLSDAQVNKSVSQLYERQKELIYSFNKIYPVKYGVLQSKGGLRKYSLVTVDCYHFAYNPITQQLYYSPDITVDINYRMPSAESDRAKFWRRLKDDITFDKIAKEKIYNWEQTQVWYHTDNPKNAHGFYIILPASQRGAVDSLVNYRQSNGFDVHVITTEHIDSVVEGIDLAQKIRNFLRANMADIEYALFVGYITNMPMRSLVPINNLPSSWSIPSDLYYAELTERDSLSWNSDGDFYYGEVCNSNYQPPGDDNPDYHQDIHVGRIPVDNPSAAAVCQTIIAFDSNTDRLYKEAALLPASIPFYENQNHEPIPRVDGSEDMEALMNDGIISRDNAVYLYEKAGLRPSPYPSTDSLCKMNQIAYWYKKGVMYEYHHGSPTGYARLVWVWDDGDSVPENPELEHISSLFINDVPNINNDYSSTTILRSCSCGKPDQYNLTMRLMDHGVSSSVISGTDGVWVILDDRGGLPHHFLVRLMKDTTVTDGVIGDAFSLAKIDFMDSTGWWLNAYVLNHFCDPATKQLGRETSVEEKVQRTPISSFSVYPNPTAQSVTIHVQTSTNRNIELDVFDKSGRLVQKLFRGTTEGSRQVTTKLPTGIYFLRYRDGDRTEFKKVIIVSR